MRLQFDCDRLQDDTSDPIATPTWDFNCRLLGETPTLWQLQHETSIADFLERLQLLWQLQSATPTQLLNFRRDSLPNDHSTMRLQFNWRLLAETPTNRLSTPATDSNSINNSYERLQLPWQLQSATPTECSPLEDTPFQLTTQIWDSNSIADSCWDRLQLTDCQVQHSTPDLIATPTLYSNFYGNSNIILTTPTLQPNW